MLPQSSALSRRRIRLFFAAVVLVCVFLLFNSYVAYANDAATNIESSSSVPFEQRDPIVPPRENVTVMATQNTGNVGGALVAFAPDGRLLYHNATHLNYHDIDPVEGTRSTVLVLATIEVDDPACNASPCRASVIETVNLTTGETERLYTHHRHVTSGSASWHDVDRIDGSHFVVADIALDRVFVVDISTGMVEWSWQVQSEYPISSGGSFPGDWTHMNDVEHLGGGRFMADLRNQDQVVFLDRQAGLLENWTLGSDDHHDVLFEQHNPDYIPEENGGPAVVVADSENNRVVEYQRTDGAWNRTWVWRDSQLQWPRDADRLPNGHTLITDSNGHRLLEVDRSGEVVWELGADLKIYEAERLGTGDESTNGPSAVRANLSSRTVGGDSGGSSQSVSGRIFGVITGLLPLPVLNGIFFIMPAWISVGDLLPVALLGATLVAWGGLELRWSPLSVDFAVPVRVGWNERDE